MKKYSVLVDLDRLKDPNNGLGQVAIFLAEQFSSIQDELIDFTFLVPGKFVGKFGNSVQYETVSARRRYFPSLCKRYDLWYTIHQDSWFRPSDLSTPFIMTINDLNFLGEKSPAKAKMRLRRLQKKVDRTTVITAISNYTASVIRKNLQTGDTPLEVIYFGVEVKTFADVPRPAYVPEGELLFTIGVVQPKKNQEVLIEFMKELPEDHVLIIAGNKAGEYSGQLEKRIRELGLQNRVILPGLISDEDKYWLYTHCKAVLFPSKFEGMGFPPVEAMRCGKPVFASTLSSIPEVCGDKAYYWEHFDPEYMAAFFNEKIKEFEQDPGLSGILRDYSMKYSWENAAREFILLFKKVLESRKSQG